MIQNKQYPDITEGDYFSNYAQDGLLYSASDVLSDPGNLLPAFKAQGTYNGTQYGMPFTTSSRTLFYNKKLFTQAGITAAPQTWADVEADAAKIKALGDVGFGLPLGAEEAQAESLLWMLGDGGGYQTDGKYTINSAANVEAFTFLKGLVAAGDTEPNPGTVNRTDLWQKFAQGNDRHDQRLAGPHPDHRVGRRPEGLRLDLGPDRGQDRPAAPSPSASATTSPPSRRTATRRRSRNSSTSPTRTSTSWPSTRSTTCSRRRPPPPRHCPPTRCSRRSSPRCRTRCSTRATPHGRT